MKKKFNTTLEEELIRELKIEAINRGLNVNELIEEMWYIYKIHKSAMKDPAYRNEYKKNNDNK